ncbi:hypothetical protein GGI25_001065 [Coemansia spiralis]|uniref:Uncharacterized protein n=2 Tax=Coemansia TaxID=4863 RepID=A0A9W8L0C2_9FUNG|nr:hypothetical protein EDC05_000735 [Coemansia umbellata]KAJ2625170.1 hypothetical protein GGI26_000973 [Coemansia sp. RSA 1358]KAJ2679876.1 hypothetical protein GGI25_001065 [Coemansia spiralis]
MKSYIAILALVALSAASPIAEPQVDQVGPFADRDIRRNAEPAGYDAEHFKRQVDQVGDWTDDEAGP